MSSEAGDARRRRVASTMVRGVSVVSADLKVRGSSLLTKFQKNMLGLKESETVRCREWLFCLAEFMLAFSWNCVGARERSEQTFEMRGITPRDDTMNTLFYLGMVSFANPVVGQLADSLTGYYFMALLNIILNFTLASLFFVCEIIDATSSEDVYATLFSDVLEVNSVSEQFDKACNRLEVIIIYYTSFRVSTETIFALMLVYLWLFVPIKCLGFIRYVYAMDQVSEGKGSTFAIHFTFIFNVFNLGGNFLYYATVQDGAPTTSLLPTIAFCFNGIVFFYFAYMLRPMHRIKFPPVPPGGTIKVWGVIFKAIWRCKCKISPKEWMDFDKTGCNKDDIARTRHIVHLFLMITPTTGFLLFTTYNRVIFKEFFDILKVTGPDVSKSMRWVCPMSTLVVIVSTEYVLIPLLRLCNVNVTFLRRFVLGYISMLLAAVIVAGVTIATEKVAIRHGNGIFRVYNTMAGDVLLKSMQLDYTHLNATVLHQEAWQADFEASERNLFRLAVTFKSAVSTDHRGNHTEYTQLFSVIPERVVQYVAIAPSSIIRVPGIIPVKEGPPGQNDISKPRCFIVSLIGDRMRSINVINEETKFKYEFDIDPGEFEFFQVQEGNYTLQYKNSVGHKTNSLLETGGLYGMYLYPGLNEYKIDIDKIIPENTLNGWLELAVTVPLGLAKVCGQVSLDAFVYSTAPDGLKGLAYGFYLFCIHFAAWFLFVGFLTWHHFITPNIIMYYAIIAFVSFLICLTVLMKYGDHYSM